MSPTLKRILLILLLLAVSALIAFGLYYVFRSSAPVGPGGTGTTPGELPGSSGTLPGSGTRTSTTGGAEPGVGTLPGGTPIETTQPATYYQQSPITQVSSDFAVHPSLSSVGNLRYHNVGDGKFYRIMPDGTAEALSDQVFYNVQKVTWARTNDKAVIEYPDESKIIYDFEKERQVTLPKHWSDFTFSPDSTEVAAKSLGLSPENRWLVVTKDDGTGTRLIEPLGNNADRVTMGWSPSRQTVALSQTGQPQGLDRREVLFIGLNGENFKSTIVEGLNFEPAWSPTGKRLLYSVDSERSEFKPELWVVNAYGEEIGSGRQNIQLNTWAHKCAFQDDTILYCAVPRELPVGAGMSPDIAARTPDDLYKIDLRTGLKTNISLGEGTYTVNSINFNAEQNKLIFTDNTKAGVFQVNL